MTKIGLIALSYLTMFIGVVEHIEFVTVLGLVLMALSLAVIETERRKLL